MIKTNSRGSKTFWFSATAPQKIFEFLKHPKPSGFILQYNILYCMESTTHPVQPANFTHARRGIHQIAKQEIAQAIRYTECELLDLRGRIMTHLYGDESDNTPDACGICRKVSPRYAELENQLEYMQACLEGMK